MLPPGVPLLDTEACPLDIELSSSGNSSSSAVASPADGAAAVDAGGPLAYTLFHVDRQPGELLQWFGSKFPPGSATRLEFPASLSKAERARWHRCAEHHGLEGQSEGVGEQRRLVIVPSGSGGSYNGGTAHSGRPALTHEQVEEARLIYDACQMAGGAFWSMSRGEAEALAASGDPLPADLQASQAPPHGLWGSSCSSLLASDCPTRLLTSLYRLHPRLPMRTQAVVDRFERGQGLHSALREGRAIEALDILAFDPKLGGCTTCTATASCRLFKPWSLHSNHSLPTATRHSLAQRPRQRRLPCARCRLGRLGGGEAWAGMRLS